MKEKFLLALIFCSCSFLSFATTDKYRCIIRDNPATTLCIAWNQVNGQQPVVYYDIIDHGVNASAYAFSKTVDRTTFQKGMNNNFARLTGLSPNTVYYFVIEDDNSISSRFSFKTSSDIPSHRLSFVAGGDSRNNRPSRRNANLLVAKLRPNAVLFGGDMTNLDTNMEWMNWLDDWQLTTANDGRMTAIIPTRGNHEFSNTSISELFDSPHNDIYYAITFGGNLYRAYTLNTLIPVNGNQKTWLENDFLSHQQVLWKGAQYHHPMRPHVSTKQERNDMVTHWAPLFETYGLNFAIECDAHTVKQTHPIRSSSALGSDEGFIRDDANGVTYIGEGCWGAPLRLNDDTKDWTAFSGSFNQVKWIFIDQDSIEIRTVKTDNAPIVGALQDANRFSMPPNIDVWTPAPGEDVLTILKPQGFPEITLFDPLDGMTLMTIQSILLQAEAFDGDGQLIQVEFFVNGNSVGSDSMAPYNLTWLPPGAGTYTIHAKAMDNDGKTGYSNLARIEVYNNGIPSMVDVPINTGYNDAEQAATGAMQLTSSILNLGANNNKVGLRFANVPIPSGAAILDAYIQFTSALADSLPSNLAISMENNLNPFPFVSTPSNIGQRNQFPGAIPWSPPAWLAAGLSGIEQRTPNLSTPIQSMINNPSWASGNALVFIFEGTGLRRALSYEGNSNAAARLVVNFSYTVPSMNRPFIPDVGFCPGTTVALNSTGNYAHYFWNKDIRLGQADSLVNINTSGQYVLRVMDAYGQVLSDTATVTAFGGPQFDLGPNQLISNGPFVFSVPPNFAAYQWNTGETTASIQALYDGIYSLTVTDSNGCTAIDTVMVINNNTHVQQLEESKEDLTLYPNPARDFIQIDLNMKASDFPVEIILSNNLGQVVHQATYFQKQLRLDLRKIPSGTYHLKLVNAQKKRFARSLVVE